MVIWQIASESTAGSARRGLANSRTSLLCARKPLACDMAVTQQFALIVVLVLRTGPRPLKRMLYCIGTQVSLSIPPSPGPAVLEGKEGQGRDTDQAAS